MVFERNLVTSTLTTKIVALLDRVLLILLVVELLYAVQGFVSRARAHARAASPYRLDCRDPARLVPRNSLKFTKIRHSLPALYRRTRGAHFHAVISLVFSRKRAGLPEVKRAEFWVTAGELQQPPSVCHDFMFRYACDLKSSINFELHPPSRFITRLGSLGQ